MESIISLMHYIGAFLAIITVIVAVHEFGHYLFARLCGVKIEAFSVGFGKELFGWTDRHGTRWQISALPIGGFVRMYGDANEASAGDPEYLEKMNSEERRQAFHYKPLYQKALVVLGGPLFNFLLCMAILFFFYTSYGRQSTPPVVGSVMEESAAAAAGLQEGDRILAMGGREIKEFDDIRYLVVQRGGVSMETEILRGDERLSLVVTPEKVETVDLGGNMTEMGRLGVTAQLQFEELTMGEAAVASVADTYGLAVQTLDGIASIIKGYISPTVLRGPVGIAQLSGEVFKKDLSSEGGGFPTVLWYMALLSVNLGLINLFPIPMLDGGHLLYYGLEGLRGQPLSQKIQEFGFRLGFAMIITLMLFTTFNDITRLTALF